MGGNRVKEIFIMIAVSLLTYTAITLAIDAYDRQWLNNYAVSNGYSKSQVELMNNPNDCAGSFDNRYGVCIYK